jgi:hypothetical protein
MLLLLLPLIVPLTLSSPPLPLPSWSGPVPSPKVNKSAGLPPIPLANHHIVYNATAQTGGRNPFGTYNHGPMMIAHGDLFFMSWYNAPKDENTYKRSVCATSSDKGKTWSKPVVLFDNFTKPGEENGPWTILGDANDGTNDTSGRLYTQSGTVDAGLHLEGIQSVMRRVSIGSDSKLKLGPIFWLNKTVPVAFKHLNYPTYLEMDEITQRDAKQLLASLVRTLVKYPDSVKENNVQHHPSKMVYNERSLYKVPGTRQVVNLLRGGGPKTLSASVCTLPASTLPIVTPDRTLFSCRAGVGDAFMNLVEVLELPPALEEKNETNYMPRTCEFSDPVRVTIPDSHSRTCASVLPSSSGRASDGIYLVGNQIDSGRDPVTLSISKDGLHFDHHWAVNYGAPPILYPGQAKVVGFQYPGAMILNGIFYVSYSIGKENIGFTQFPLSVVWKE